MERDLEAFPTSSSSFSPFFIFISSVKVLSSFFSCLKKNSRRRTTSSSVCILSLCCKVQCSDKLWWNKNTQPKLFKLLLSVENQLVGWQAWKCKRFFFKGNLWMKKFSVKFGKRFWNWSLHCLIDWLIGKIIFLVIKIFTSPW